MHLNIKELLITTANITIILNLQAHVPQKRIPITSTPSHVMGKHWVFFIYFTTDIYHNNDNSYYAVYAAVTLKIKILCIKNTIDDNIN